MWQGETPIASNRSADRAAALLLCKVQGLGFRVEGGGLRGNLNRCEGLLLESQGQNLDLTVSCVPYSGVGYV